MIKKLQTFITSGLILCALQHPLFSQAPTLGTAADFVLFSSNGAVSNSGISQITGSVGTNSGSSTAFGNVNGVMHDNDASSAEASADLLIAYNQLNDAIATEFPAPLLGNGQKLNAGIYSIPSEATLNLELTFDGQGDENALFIIKIEGAFSTSANSKIILINGAKACNIFWKIEGLVSMSSGTTMRGNIIANNAAININTGNTLEGRALSTTGAVTVENTLASLPIGCGSIVLTGPKAPDLGKAACFGLFSSDGDVSNSGITNISGDVGSNKGGVTGFDPDLVSGTIHPIPDLSTEECARDLAVAYNSLNLLSPDIELLYPAQFGNNLVLTPHTYVLKGAATLTDTIVLNAQGNVKAVFVIQINGALTTSTYAHVKLINGAAAENVYWKIEGAVSISNYSTMRGTIVCNNGSLGALNTGVVLYGRALTTAGALSTVAITTNSVIPCTPVSVAGFSEGQLKVAFISPNPFSTGATLRMMNKAYLNNSEFTLYNATGDALIRQQITGEMTELKMGNQPSGIYFYTITNKEKMIETGKLVSE